MDGGWEVPPVRSPSLTMLSKLRKKAKRLFLETGVELLRDEQLVGLHDHTR